MQIVSDGDNLHEMLLLILSYGDNLHEKKKTHPFFPGEKIRENINLSSAESTHRVVKVTASFNKSIISVAITRQYIQLICQFRNLPT